MSPDRSHRCRPLGRSLDVMATLAAVGAAAPEPPNGPQATTTTSNAKAESEPRMRPTLRDELGTASHLKEDRSGQPEHASSTCFGSSVAVCERPRYAPRPAGRHF